MGKNVPSQFTILNVREVLAEWSAEHSEKSAEGVPPLVGAPPATGGPYPRILDTGCDYAALGSVAARWAS